MSQGLGGISSHAAVRGREFKSASHRGFRARPSRGSYAAEGDAGGPQRREQEAERAAAGGSRALRVTIYNVKDLLWATPMTGAPRTTMRHGAIFGRAILPGRTNLMTRKMGNVVRWSRRGTMRGRAVRDRNDPVPGVRIPYGTPFISIS